MSAAVIPVSAFCYKYLRNLPGVQMPGGQDRDFLRTHHNLPHRPPRFSLHILLSWASFNTSAKSDPFQTSPSEYIVCGAVQDSCNLVNLVRGEDEFSGRIIGIPPPQLASTDSCCCYSRGQSGSSAPCCLPRVLYLTCTRSFLPAALSS